MLMQKVMRARFLTMSLSETVTSGRTQFRSPSKTGRLRADEARRRLLVRAELSLTRPETVVESAAEERLPSTRTSRPSLRVIHSLKGIRR